jgi:hypothetical protein
MLDNVRKACCVAGGMDLVPKDADVLEVRCNKRFDSIQILYLMIEQADEELRTLLHSQ